MALSLMETLCRVVAAQEHHASAAGIAISLVVPDSDGMRGPAPPPLPRALPALLRAGIAAVAPGAAVELRVEVATSAVVQLSISGPLRPEAALAPCPDGGLGGLELPAPARRSVTMVVKGGGRFEDRSSAATRMLRLVVRLHFDPRNAAGADSDRAAAGLAGGTPSRPRRS